MHFLERDKSTSPYVPRCAAFWEREGGIPCLCFLSDLILQTPPNSALTKFIYQLRLGGALRFRCAAPPLLALMRGSWKKCAVFERPSHRVSVPHSVSALEGG